MKARKLFAGIIACAAALSAASVCAYAEEAEEPAGYVAFTAIKSTLNQGFTVEPVMVPFYEGDTGIDIVERTAEINAEESDYGSYITGFADDGDVEIILPDELEGLVELTSGRNTEGFLSAYDYTAESGWSYFINGEYATVGISDYIPADGDVLEFRYTIYGYGADLGVDNSSWGGAAAVVEPVNAAELIQLCASADEELKNTWNYVNAMELLAQYGSTQEELDACAAGIIEGNIAPIVDFTEETTVDAAQTAEAETPAEEASEDKGSPDTGVEGLAVVFGTAVIAAGAIALSKRK